MRWRNGALALAMVAGFVACKPARSTPRVVVACERESTSPPAPFVDEPAPTRPVENLALSWRTHDRSVVAAGPGSFVLTDGRALFAVDARDGRQTAHLRAIQNDAPLTFALAQLPARIGVLETFVIPCPDKPDCTTTTQRLLGLAPATEGVAWSVELGIPTARRSLRAVADDRLQLFLLQEGDRARAFDVDGREQWSLSGLTRFDSLSWELAFDRLLVGDSAHTTALSPEHGCSFWTVDEKMIGAHARHVVTVRSAGDFREILVRAAADGAVEHRFATTLQPERAAIVGEVLFVQSNDRSLAAYDLQTKRALWTRSAVDAWVPTRDAVFVADRGCVLRALAPSSGAVTYAYSLACDPTGALMPRLWSVDDALGGGVAIGWNGELVVLARASTKAPPVAKTIRGVVRVNGVIGANVRLYVGEQVVRTDDEGRYSAQVTTPGSVRVLPSTGDLARFAKDEDGKHPECQLFVKGPGYPPPPVAIEGAGTEQTVSFDLDAAYVCIGI